MNIGTHRVLVIGLSVVGAVAATNCQDSDSPETSLHTVEYHRDIQPMIAAHCGHCHNEGGIAPFKLETYEDVAVPAKLLLSAIESRTMPPWGAEPGHRDLRYDPSLSDEQIEMFATWVAEGTPEGNPEDVGAPLELDLGKLERSDVQIKMAQPYEPTGVPDDYRCFVVDWPEDQTKFITGYRGVPGNLKVVHHLVIFMVGPGEVDKLENYDTDEEPGYPCYGGLTPTKDGEPREDVTMANGQLIGQWAPGLRGQQFTPGTGVRVEPGSKAVLQVHYNTERGTAPDQSMIEFAVEDSVEREGQMFAYLNAEWYLGDYGMEIPAGEIVEHIYDNKFLTTMGNSPFREGAEIHAALPHMHRLGREISLSKRSGGVEETLLRIPAYDFHWQRDYAFVEPVRFDGLDELVLRCRWDNTEAGRIKAGVTPSEPHDVYWGEGTNDEMCVAALYVTTPKQP